MMFKDIKAFSGYSVRDIAESLHFYGVVLGLQISRPMDQLLLHIAGGAEVFLYRKPNHQPATFTVLNFPVANLEQAMKELKGRGVDFIIYDQDGFKTDEEGVFQGEGPKIAWFTDPSGNILSVLEEE